MVYVLDMNGQPLMPTTRHGKVRRLLKTHKAKVIKRCPFIIQLLYETGDIIQNISLGIDAGSKTIGTSATTDRYELYKSEIELRSDITDLLSTRRELRRSRRNRTTRYRKPKFNNRVKSKHKGWLAPSVENKIHTHMMAVSRIHALLPVTDIKIEVASFDIQKIKNPDISGIEYQQGEQLDFWNVREYVLYRDNHTCQCCKGKSKDKRLCVHHIESRKTGGNAPNDLITLCKTCHDAYHKGEIQLPKHIKRGMKFNDATFMGIMRWTLYERLKSQYPSVSLTYGYITKSVRIEHGLPKAHHIDAKCISGNPDAIGLDHIYYEKKMRCHNRRIHKNGIAKGGYRKRNQADYIVKGFRLFDKVRYQDIECFVFGRRASGSFDIRKLDGTRISAGVSCKKLTLLETRHNFIVERSVAGM